MSEGETSDEKKSSTAVVLLSLIIGLAVWDIIAKVTRLAPTISAVWLWGNLRFPWMRWVAAAAFALMQGHVAVTAYRATRIQSLIPPPEFLGLFVTFVLVSAVAYYVAYLFLLMQP